MRNRSGVTLIELILVITLIATLASLATVNFMRSYRERNLQHFVRECASYLRYLQFKSIEEGKTHRLTADEQGRLLSFIQGKRPKDYDEITTPFSKRFSRADSFSIRFRRGNEIYFFPDGVLTPNELFVEVDHEPAASIQIKNRLGAFQIKFNG